MFDYTKATIHQIINELRLSISVIGKLTKIATIIYFIYAIFAPSGYLFANIILGTFALAHFIFELITADKQDKKTKKTKTLIKHIHTWCEIGVKVITLGLIFYSLYFSIVTPSFVSLLLAGLMAIGWILQVFIEIITLIIESKWQLLAASLQADTKGITEVGNFFKKITGDEVVDTSINERTMKKLNNNVAVWKAHKKQEKEEKKRLKKERKERVKAKKIAEKIAKKENKQAKKRSA